MNETVNFFLMLMCALFSHGLSSIIHLNLSLLSHNNRFLSSRRQSTVFQNISSPDVHRLFNLGGDASFGDPLLASIANTHGILTDVYGNLLQNVNLLNSTNETLRVLTSTGNLIGQITNISNGTATVTNHNQTVGSIQLADLIDGLSQSLTNIISKSLALIFITNSGAEQLVTAIGTVVKILLDKNDSIIGTKYHRSKNVFDNNGAVIGNLKVPTL